MASEIGALAGQVALVTGCGRQRGIGHATALALAEAGADVVVTDVAVGGTRNKGEEGLAVDEPGLPALVAQIEALGRRSAAVIGDVGESADVERMLAEAIAALGHVDILVNNAAAPQGADRNWSWMVPESAFDAVMRINAHGVFLMSTAFVRHRLAQEHPTGRIVNIASNAGQRGLPQRAAYCASKFAVIGLTQVMAVELAERGITVNAVCPGAVDTPRHSARIARAASSDPSAATAVAFTSPVPRVGVPADIARAVVFLAAPESDYVTGQCLNVDGGVVMVR